MLALRFAGRQALRHVAARARVPSHRRALAAASWPDHEILPMPALSPTMESGNIGEWHLKVGDEVIPGNAVAEIVTDKASVAFEAQDEGFIAALLHKAGPDDIAVGTPIAVVVSDADDVAAFSNFTLADATGGDSKEAAVPAAPAAKTIAPPPSPPAAAVPAAAPKPAPAAQVQQGAEPAGEQISWRRQVREASPLAASMLEEQLAYEEQFGFTGMEPLERAAQEE